MTSSKWGPRRSILALLPVLLAGPYIAWRHHTILPEPLPANVTGISEARILEYARILSEDMGFRTVGTREHAAADTWMTGVLEDIRERCVSNEKVTCEVWRQEGNGSHRFDIMNTRLYKSYVGLSNFVVRLSAKGNPNSTEHAVLLNAHLDSQLPGPGAADDAISCGVMLDIINVLLAEDEWEPTYSAIFLFNHAEESLQDGSHLFSTQHPIAPTVRAVVNLEAAGTTGREILFQATSEQMIEAYSHVPRPFGTVFASDIFGSGIIMSDTDFRQFQEYLNVTGLDMAIIGHSYFYHTRSDVIANIQAGVGQHMGENALALVRHLTSGKSPLPSLVEGYTKPSTVYWSHVVGPFVVYSASTAKGMYGATLLLAIFLRRAGWNDVGKGMTLGMLSFVGALLGANAVALGMVAIGRGMSWFKNEVGSVMLFGPGAIVGALSAPILFSIQSLPSERAVFEGVIFLNLILAFVVQLAGIGSASLMWLTGLPVLVGLVVNDLVSKDSGVSLIGYAVGGFVPLITGTLVLLPTLEVFVPLTGRMSAEAPADHLIATIVTVIGTLMLPLLAPFTVRFLHVTKTDGHPHDIESGRRGLKGGIVRCSIACLATMAVYAKNQVYDEMHMRRVFVLRTENITTGEHHLHMAASDAAPGFPALVADVASAIPTLHGEAALEGASLKYFEVEMNDYNGDWDPLYPFSAFLTPYKIPLSAGANAETVSYWHDKFTVQAVEDVRDVIKGERSLTVRIRHPGLIWTVIAFDAHVLSWDLDGNPPPERARHHVKEASFYGKDEWEVKMIVKMEDNAEGIVVHFIGLQEGAMWPGKKKVYEAYLRQAESEDDVVYSRGGGEAATMALFKELDEWLDERMAKAVDATLIGAVAGVETI